MPIVLLCSPDPFEAELGGTALWRSDFERHHASRAEEARVLVWALMPHLVLVDRDLPDAVRFVSSLRSDGATRGLSIAVLARGDLEPSEVELLEAGANAILRVPPGPDWDERLLRLANVPARMQVRFLVTVEVSGAMVGGLSMDGTSRNLSLAGLLLDAAAPLEVGTEARLQVRLPGHAHPVEADGCVVREEGPAVYGVEFRQFVGDGRERLGRFLDALRAR